MADVREHVADPAFMRHPPAALLDRRYLARRAALIDRGAAGDPLHGAPSPGGTVYLAAADAQGMMVSYIQSNYMGFGSGVVVPGTGVSLQNRGAGFVLRPDHANAVGPRKRPFHTIIPGFVTTADGRPLMAFGLMGGLMQAQGHVQLALRILAYGQNPQAACDAPRWRVLDGRRVAVEPGFPVATRAGLAATGPRDRGGAVGKPLRLWWRAGDLQDAGRLCRRLRPTQGRSGRRFLSSPLGCASQQKCVARAPQRTRMPAGAGVWLRRDSASGECVLAKNSSRVGPRFPQVVVLVGATGDLSRRKLLARPVPSRQCRLHPWQPDRRRVAGRSGCRRLSRTRAQGARSVLLAQGQRGRLGRLRAEPRLCPDVGRCRRAQARGGTGRAGDGGRDPADPLPQRAAECRAAGRATSS